MDAHEQKNHVLRQVGNTYQSSVAFLFGSFIEVSLTKCEILKVYNMKIWYMNTFWKDFSPSA